MEHFGNESNGRRFVGVLFRELERQLERAVLERRVMRAENDRVPDHDVVVGRGTGHATGRILLQPFKVTHQPPSRRC